MFRALVLAVFAALWAAAKILGYFVVRVTSSRRYDARAKVPPEFMVESAETKTGAVISTAVPCIFLAFYIWRAVASGTTQDLVLAGLAAAMLLAAIWGCWRDLTVDRQSLYFFGDNIKIMSKNGKVKQVRAGDIASAKIAHANSTIFPHAHPVLTLCGKDGTEYISGMRIKGRDSSLLYSYLTGYGVRVADTWNTRLPVKSGR